MHDTKLRELQRPPTIDVMVSLIADANDEDHFVKRVAAATFTQHVSETVARGFYVGWMTYQNELRAIQRDEENHSS
jgi:hypothetical protein